MEIPSAFVRRHLTNARHAFLNVRFVHNKEINCIT
jgi:hypothetical protein